MWASDGRTLPAERSHWALSWLLSPTLLHNLGSLEIEPSEVKTEVCPKPSDKGVADDAVAAQDPAILKRVGGRAKPS